MLRVFLVQIFTPGLPLTKPTHRGVAPFFTMKNITSQFGASDNSGISANSYPPTVVKPGAGGDRAYDIYSALHADRIIFLNGVVDNNTAGIIVAQLLFLNSLDRKKDIHFYINSPGGSVTDGLAIYDTMKHLDCDVATYVIGMAASMGAFLLSAGTKRKRYALPHATVMIHQPLGGAQGQVTDMEIHVNESKRIKALLNGLLAEHTGKPVEQVAQDTERDNFLTAQMALEYGLVDRVIVKPARSAS